MDGSDNNINGMYNPIDDNRIRYQDNDILEDGNNTQNNNNVDNNGNNYIQDNNRSDYIEDRFKDRLNGIGQGLINDTAVGQSMKYWGGRAVNRGRKIKGAVGRGIKSATNNSRIANAAVEGTKYYARGMGNKIKNKIKNAHPIRGGIRMAGGIAAGAALGSLGLAAGMVSGDPSKTLQYTAAGLAGGYRAGTSTTEAVQSAVSIDGTKDTMAKAYLGEDGYKEKQIQKRIKEVQHDNKIRDELVKRLGSEEEAQMAIKNTLPDAVRYGLDNANEIAAVHNRVKAGESIKVATKQVEYMKDFGKNSNKLGAKDEEDFDKTIKNRIDRSNTIRTKEEKEEMFNRQKQAFNGISEDLFKKI